MKDTVSIKETNANVFQSQEERSRRVNLIPFWHPGALVHRAMPACSVASVLIVVYLLPFLLVCFKVGFI